MDVTLTINGQDFSPVLSTYATTYEIDYGKTVKALDGTEYTGNALIRPVIAFSLFPMTDAQAKTYYDALTLPTPALCSYTDKATNMDRTIRMRISSNLEYAFGLRSVDGNRYYKGGTITMRGVHCLSGSGRVQANVESDILTLAGPGVSVESNVLSMTSYSASVFENTLYL